MKKASQTVPLGTPCVYVDPLFDFIDPKGEFTKCYGLEDTEPVRGMRRPLTDVAVSFRGKATNILCSSLYRENQFGVKGLEKLCTTEEGRVSAIHPSHFDHFVTKVDNSLLSIGEDELAKLIGDHKVLIITGITLSSCIIKTIEDFRRLMRNIRIVVPADAVAARKSRETASKEGKGKHEILEELSSHTDTQIVVVDSWRNIEFLRSKLQKPYSFVTTTVTE